MTLRPNMASSGTSEEIGMSWEGKVKIDLTLALPPSMPRCYAFLRQKRHESIAPFCETLSKASHSHAP